MRATLWGTRGSLPRVITNQHFIEKLTSLIDSGLAEGISDTKELLKAAESGRLETPLSYGGHTSCTEVATDQASLFIDAGSGIVSAGDAALQAGRNEFHIFLTHLHWDHIFGLPFFIPIFTPGHKLNIYHVHKTAPEHIKIQFNGINFPVTWDMLGAEIEFHQLKLYDTTTLADLQITPFALDHPGGSFGYRVESGGHSLAVGVDGEYTRFTPEELGPDLAYYQNLDAFVFDAQYRMDELANKYDWGHCSPAVGVDLALREGIKNLVLTHHDPRREDADVTAMRNEACSHREQQLAQHKDKWEQWGQPDGPRIVSAYDGMRLNFGAAGLEVT